MSLLDTIYQCRAIKHFDPEHKLTAAEEQQLFEITVQAPTS